MTELTFGRERHWRPICIKGPHGFYGGPAGYVETDDPNTTALIVEAGRTGEPPLWRVKRELDRRKNA